MIRTESYQNFNDNITEVFDNNRKWLLLLITQMIDHPTSQF